MATIPRDWKRVGPGIYDDGKGAMHVVLTELLAGAGYRDTPDNRKVLQEAMRKIGVKYDVDVAAELGKP
jgi:hypothetical protein